MRQLFFITTFLIALSSCITPPKHGDIEAGWKLCWSDQDKSQLFNLNNDPGEITYLFDQAKYQNKINELENKIVAWQKQVGDTVSIVRQN